MTPSETLILRTYMRYCRSTGMAGNPVRDTAEACGVPMQRVSQIVYSVPHAARARYI